MRSPEPNLRGCFHALAVHRHRSDVARFLSLGAALHEQEPLEREVDAHGSGCARTRSCPCAANRGSGESLSPAPADRESCSRQSATRGLVLARDRRDLHDEELGRAARLVLDRERIENVVRLVSRDRRLVLLAAAAPAGTAAGIDDSSDGSWCFTRSVSNGTPATPLLRDIRCLAHAPRAMSAESMAGRIRMCRPFTSAGCTRSTRMRW